MSDRIETHRVICVIEERGQTYTLEALRAKFGPVEPERGKGIIEALAWPEVEAHLSNIDALLGCARSQLIKPTTQTGRVLGGEMIAFPVNGKVDDSRSMNACAVALGLLLRGYMDDEIAAVLIHLYRKWGSERDKGTAWVKLDAARCLAYAHEQQPNVKQSPTRYRKTAQAEPIVDVRPTSRARTDRPQRFTPAALFLEYQRRPDLCDLKRKARASALDISTATLDRLEDSLEKEKLIDIETDPRRQGSRVILRGVINIAPAEVLSAAPETEAPEQPSSRTESGQTAIEPPQCIGETPAAPDTPGPARAVDVVREAFDVLAVGGARLSLSRVRRYVDANAGREIDPSLIARIYYRERDRRQWARQDAKEAAKALTMTRAALERKSKALATQAASIRHAIREGKKQPDILEYTVGDKTYTTKAARTTEKTAAWLEHRAGIYAAEEARRDALEAKRIAEQGYVLAEQRAMLDQVDTVRLDLRRGRTGRAARPAGLASAGSVLPSGSSLPNAVALIAELHRKKAERSAVGAGYD